VAGVAIEPRADLTWSEVWAQFSRLGGGGSTCPQTQGNPAASSEARGRRDAGVQLAVRVGGGEGRRRLVLRKLL
jgi:hypothetical protein